MHVDRLVTSIVAAADMLELGVHDDTHHMKGILLESTQLVGMGHVATILVQSGTLRVGDTLISGTCVCKVRTLQDSMGRTITHAGAACPVQVAGWRSPPVTGAIVLKVSDEVRDPPTRCHRWTARVVSRCAGY